MIDLKGLFTYDDTDSGKSRVKPWVFGLLGAGAFFLYVFFLRAPAPPDQPPPQSAVGPSPARAGQIEVPVRERGPTPAAPAPAVRSGSSAVLSQATARLRLENDELRRRLLSRDAERDRDVRSAPMLVFVAQQGSPGTEPGTASAATVSLVVPAGTELPAVLERPVISSTGGTPVVAVVTSDDPLPAGTKFLGTGRSDFSSMRIMVDFSQAVLPDGRGARVNASVLAHDRLAGLVGEVDNKTGQKLLMALGFSAIQGVAAAQRAFTVGPFGTTTLDPGAVGQNTALETAAGMAQDQARQQYSEAQRTMPTITVPQGSVVAVLLQEPLEVKQ